MNIRWSDEKNRQLIKERGISFEFVESMIKDNNFIANIEHPNQKKYPNQRMFILNINDYIYCVPFIENENEIFLKTIYPNGKYNKIYNTKD